MVQFGREELFHRINYYLNNMDYLYSICSCRTIVVSENCTYIYFHLTVPCFIYLSTYLLFYLRTFVLRKLMLFYIDEFCLFSQNFLNLGNVWTKIRKFYKIHWLIRKWRKLCNDIFIVLHAHVFVFLGGREVDF